MVTIYIPIRTVEMRNDNGERVTVNIVKDGLWRAERVGQFDHGSTPFINLIRDGLAIIGGFNDIVSGEEIAVVLQPTTSPDPERSDDALTHDITVTT